jgi:hypothetical protein
LPIDEKEESKFRENLKNAYKITDKGDLKWFIGFKITRDRAKRIIYLDQEAAIKKLLEEQKMHDSKSKETPMAEKDQYLVNPPNDEKTDATKYRSIIGSLIYFMTGTRPDISFAVTKMAQFMTNPYKSHLTGIMRILRYLKGSSDLKLMIKGNDNENEGIVAYADADYANDKNDRKSISGYVIKFNDNVIAWKTNKQNVISLSTTEAELYALSTTVQETYWIKHFMESLGIDLSKITVFEDNQGTIALVKNGRKDGRTKHVEIKHWFLTDAYKEKKIDIKYLSTEMQLADMMTKPLGRVKFQKFRKELGLLKVHDLGE